MTYRVALTGGIGSGKSTVAEQFAALGVMVSDADAIAHQLTTADGEALSAIAAAFGAEMIDTNGALDRARLRNRVFADPSARRQLEGILHPLIRNRMLEETEAVSAPYALLVIPLLLETGQQALVDRVLVVDVPETVQIARVQNRSGLDPAEIKRIIASQISRAERLAAADNVIDNRGDASRLESRIVQLHQMYLEHAHQQRG
ncbi:dephospho-CoA kinase [Halochromatium salexigens]|uniref:Dephospho-CoA kinase n=1 Tax=Halochromatium salexigens TaxID=49447 RepID=A0AAJ0XFV0_HALSE|nr:dephospho-CoA kinase [Halochromatium salexigens]MBK5930090.1 dephospho-CoA kinase [Halochromatium salexigens]